MSALGLQRLLAHHLKSNCVRFSPVFVRALTDNAVWTTEKLKGVVTESKLVVFMKGTPDAPMCGFSRAVVQILEMHGVKDFRTYNVLADDDLRKNIKDFSNWPTVPQVYINGEFVGGCDIMIQLHRNGDLIDELKKIGHRSALLEEGEE